VLLSNATLLSDKVSR